MNALAYLHPEQRLHVYAARVREGQHDRDPEHLLRIHHGARLQAELSTRPKPLSTLPVPRHRALVVAGPLNRCEQHDLGF